MHENVNTVPSFAANFITNETPDVTLTVVAGIVMVHVDCTCSTYGGFPEGQPDELEGFVIFTP